MGCGRPVLSQNPLPRAEHLTPRATARLSSPASLRPGSPLLSHRPPDPTLLLLLLTLPGSELSFPCHLSPGGQPGSAYERCGQLRTPPACRPHCRDCLV